MAASALHDAVLALPEDERADLLDAVATSLAADDDLEQAWAVEVDRRLDAWDRGEVKGIPASVVFATIREHLHRRG